MRYVRDVITLSVGTALCLSQIILQFQHGEPSVPLIAAGVTLLTSYPLLKLGDRRAGADNDNNRKGA